MTQKTIGVPSRLLRRLAIALRRRGRRRMIYREKERFHHEHDALIANASGTGRICHEDCVFRRAPEREKYLERFYLLSTPLLGIYLHRFWASDEDGLHDHPWHSISVLLNGVYKEEEPERQGVPYGPTITRTRSPLHPPFKIRSKYASHRITVDPENPGAWSLFIRFGVGRRKWGFYRRRGWEAAKVQSRRDEDSSHGA